MFVYVFLQYKVCFKVIWQQNINPYLKQRDFYQGLDVWEYAYSTPLTEEKENKPLKSTVISMVKSFAFQK